MKITKVSNGYLVANSYSSDGTHIFKTLQEVIEHVQDHFEPTRDVLIVRETCESFVEFIRKALIAETLIAEKEINVSELYAQFTTSFHEPFVTARRFNLWLEKYSELAINAEAQFRRDEQGVLFVKIAKPSPLPI